MDFFSNFSTILYSLSASLLSSSSQFTPLPNSNLNGLIYVNTTSNCTFGCGSHESPFQSLSQAIEYHSTLPFDHLKKYLIVLTDGDYSGWMNNEILITKDIDIVSESGNSRINCNDVTYGFKLKNSKVSFTGLTIENCVSNFGGAFHLYNSFLAIDNCTLANNKAGIGGSIYASGGSNLKITNSHFKMNIAHIDGGAIYLADSSRALVKTTNLDCNKVDHDGFTRRSDITCDGDSLVSISQNTSTENVGFKCSKSCKINSISGESLCKNPSKLCQGDSTSFIPPILNVCSRFDYTNNNVPENFTIGDGVCNPIFENCLSSPQDCKSCYLKGLAVESYSGLGNDTKLISIKNIEFPINFPLSIAAPLNGKIFGYFKVPEDDIYKIKASGRSIGLRIFIDDVPVAESLSQQEKVLSTTFMFLESDKAHKITGEFISFTDNTERSLLLELEDSAGKIVDNSAYFYSSMICGDGIFDPEEASSCTTDKPNPVRTTPLCTHEDPNSDFPNCYHKLTKVCPSRTVPNGHISPLNKYFGKYDSLGKLISNQFIWHLPGSEHLSFGVNSINMEEGLAPIFYFGYCDDVSNNLIEDVYRSRVYDIPNELVGKALPQCSFSAETEFFDSASDYSEDKASKFDFTLTGKMEAEIKDENIDIDGKFKFIMDKSSVEAFKLHMDKSQTFVSTTIECTTSRIEQSGRTTFHPLFLQELNRAITLEKMEDLVGRYGTHYYKYAIMGGKLEVLSSSSYFKEELKSEVEETSKISFSAFVAANVFEVQGGFGGSVDTSLTNAEHESYETLSKFSKIISYGGPVGAYGPTNEESYGNFERWAKSVDRAPVPLDFKVEYIGELISPDWKNTNGLNIKTLWYQAAYNYVLRNANVPIVRDKFILNKYTMIMNFKYPEEIVGPVLPILTMNWVVHNPYTKKNVSMSYQVKIYFSSIDSNGNSNSALNSYTNGPQLFDLNKPRIMNSKTIKGVYQLKNMKVAGKSGLSMTYVHQNIGVLKSPYAFHFDAPDIWDSVKDPTFIITGMNTSLFSFPIQLINWDVDEGVVFHPVTGKVIRGNDHFVNVMLEKLYKKTLTGLDGNYNSWYAARASIREYYSIPPNKDIVENLNYMYLGKLYRVGSTPMKEVNYDYYTFKSFKATYDPKVNKLSDCDTIRNPNHFPAIMIISRIRPTWTIVFHHTLSNNWKRVIFFNTLLNDKSSLDNQFSYKSATLFNMKDRASSNRNHFPFWNYLLNKNLPPANTDGGAARHTYVSPNNSLIYDINS